MDATGWIYLPERDPVKTPLKKLGGWKTLWVGFDLIQKYPQLLQDVCHMEQIT